VEENHVVTHVKTTISSFFNGDQLQNTADFIAPQDYYIYILAVDEYENIGIRYHVNNPVNFVNAEHTLVVSFSDWLFNSSTNSFAEGRLAPNSAEMQFNPQGRIMFTFLEDNANWESELKANVIINPNERIIDQLYIIASETNYGIVPTVENKTQLLSLIPELDQIDVTSTFLSESSVLPLTISKFFKNGLSESMKIGIHYYIYTISHDMGFDTFDVEFSTTTLTGTPPTISDTYADAYVLRHFKVNWTNPLTVDNYQLDEASNNNFFNGATYKRLRITVGDYVKFETQSSHALFESFYDSTTNTIIRTDNSVSETSKRFTSSGIYAYNCFESHATMLLVIEVIHQQLDNTPIITHGYLYSNVINVDWTNPITTHDAILTNVTTTTYYNGSVYKYLQLKLGDSINFNVQSGHAFFESSYDYASNTMTRTDNPVDAFHKRFVSLGVFGYNCFANHTSMLLVIEVVY
jgi:plastocyanin